MAWRVRSKLCYGQKWILLFSPVFLLILIISVMVIPLPPPLPCPDAKWRLSRALSSMRELGLRPGIADPPPAPALQQRSSRRSKNPVAQKQSVASDDDHRNKAKLYADIQRSRYRNRGSASKRKDPTDGVQSTRRSQQPPLSEFTVNNAEIRHRIRPSSRSSVGKRTAEAYTYLERRPTTVALNSSQADSAMSVGDRRADTWTYESPRRNADRQTHDSRASVKPQQHRASGKKHRQAAKHSLGKFDNEVKEQLPVKRPSRDHKASHHPTEEVKTMSRSEDHREASSELGAAARDGGDWCQSFGEEDWSDGQGRVRSSRDLQPPPWLSQDDLKKMELLSEGQVVSKARVPAHGQVLQRGPGRGGPASSHGERCQQGRCALIKRPEDWYEVFAFHLDRVLGLNRSLPVVLRTFHSDILPYRYTSGPPRPAVWWDPDIQHVADADNDQNSVPLSWVQYQQMLQARCGRETDLLSQPCRGIQHSEWGRLALLDFLLQVNDRLDRCCCGFTPDPADLCVENLLHAKCGNSKDLLLVHILVRRADPSRLVFIDNAGRPQQAPDNLNFRLVQGVHQFPEKAVSVLRSGCLESLLLRSLHTDREFWDSRGGAAGLRPLIHVVEQRGSILLQHIRDRKLGLKRDL
ncbi:Golgi-associated kinase 1A-like [Cololabis saira]|uniref:Golgi-associated kinase 1A-like n=1 Tax=Cololabis saira TaxID=129043 RepID=UPI002AD212F6|nr:Golgi-associated kinase 1A-like [Cololabis saira]